MKLKYKSTLENITFPKNDRLHDDEKARWKSTTQSRNDEIVFDTTCVVEIALGKDGYLLLAQDDNIVYLYPDQVKHLKKILGMK